MAHTTGFSALGSLLAAVALAGPARAGDDTQLWLYASTVVPLDDDISATFELSPRLRDGGDQLLTRANVDFRLAPAVTFGTGVAYVEFAGGNEFRPHQQLTLTVGPAALRSRVEERFFADADRMGVRLRQRVLLSQQVGPESRLSGGAELLYIARSENPAKDPHIDNWRFQVAINHRFSDHVEAGVGYLLIYSPISGGADRVSHVPQVTLTFRPYSVEAESAPMSSGSLDD